MFAALDTPQILIEQRTMEHNLIAMQQKADQLGKQLRPHAKTHKSPELAREQLRFGANGVMVAKLDEAEVMLSAGIVEQSLGYPLIGPIKARRLADLLQRGLCPRVSVDSLPGLEWLTAVGGMVDRSIEVLIEIDTGLHRVGLIDPGQVVAMAEMISRERYLRFKGLTCFGGHIGKQATVDLTMAAIQEEDRQLAALVRALQRAHLSPEVVSEGGSIVAAFAEHLITATEMRPGTYIYNDVATVEAGAAQYDACAATVLTTVVSAPDPRWAVIDAGSKALSSDGTRLGGFGHVLDHPEWWVVRLNEEHGILASRDGGPISAAIGQRLRIIPNHICTAVNLHARAVLVDGGHVLKTIAIAAQGGIH